MSTKIERDVIAAIGRMIRERYVALHHEYADCPQLGQGEPCIFCCEADPSEDSDEVWKASAAVESLLCDATIQLALRGRPNGSP